MSLLAEPWFDFASFAFERLLHFYSDSPQIANLLFSGDWPPNAGVSRRTGDLRTAHLPEPPCPARNFKNRAD
ncbi:MAG: hypothetical protein ABIJ53_05935 [Verrucomicrobiota bacterium]